MLATSLVRSAAATIARPRPNFDAARLPSRPYRKTNLFLRAAERGRWRRTPAEKAQQRLREAATQLEELHGLYSRHYSLPTWALSMVPLFKIASFSRADAERLTPELALFTRTIDVANRLQADLTREHRQLAPEQAAEVAHRLEALIGRMNEMDVGGTARLLAVPLDVVLPFRRALRQLQSLHDTIVLEP
jgi:hypothetical protein